MQPGFRWRDYCALIISVSEFSGTDLWFESLGIHISIARTVAFRCLLCSPGPEAERRGIAGPTRWPVRYPLNLEAAIFGPGVYHALGISEVCIRIPG